MRMRVLVTGGFGNLGSWLTRELLQRGHAVTVTTSSGRRPPEFQAAEAIELDLTDPVRTDESLRGRAFDAVIHAGSLNDGFLEGYHWRAYRVNTEGTSSLLHSLDRSSLRRFIYLSTFHVYGAQEGWVSETDVPAPRNDYATSHLAAEFIVRQHALQSHLPATVLRLTNGYGCPVVPSSAKWHLLLNDLAAMAVRSQRLVLRSGAGTRRDFIWMGDIARAVCELIEKDASDGELFNVAYGRSMTLHEAAMEVRNAYFDHSGKEIPIELPSVAEGAAAELTVDSSRLWSVLGWQPSMRIREEALATFRIVEAVR